MPHRDDPAPLGDAVGGARRILLHGVTGAGRTTAAARISQATGIPWTRRPICNGNTESWSSMIGKDSVIRRHFRSFDRHRARVATWCSEPGAPRVLRFTRTRDLDVWIASLAAVAAAADWQVG